MSKQASLDQVIPFNVLEQMYQKRLKAIETATQARDRLREELNSAETTLKDLRQGTVVTDVPVVSQRATRQSSRKQQGVSVPDLIEQVLRKNGHAMTVKDITDNIVAMGNHSGGRDFQKSVSARLQNVKRFHRMAPGLYDLINRNGKVQSETAKPFESLAIVAAKVLIEQGEPMAVPALADAVLARGYKTSSSSDVFAQSLVSRMVKDKDTFKRVGPGVYALASWNPT